MIYPFEQQTNAAFKIHLLRNESAQENPTEYNEFIADEWSNQLFSIIRSHVFQVVQAEMGKEKPLNFQSRKKSHAYFI